MINNNNFQIGFLAKAIEYYHSIAENQKCLAFAVTASALRALRAKRMLRAHFNLHALHASCRLDSYTCRIQVA